MELTALVLAAIGGADLIRAAAQGARLRTAGVSAVLVVCALAGAALGADPLASLVLALAPVVAALGWLATMRADDSPLGFLPVVLLGGIALTAIVVPPPAVAIRVEWGQGEGLPLSLVLLAAGGALFLLESANRVVRTALRTEDVPADGDVAPSRRRRLFGQRGERATAAPDPQDVHTLRGGRLIGPLERIVVGGLLLAHAYPVVAALIAAKGIVRFPEISRDRERGTQAEYFLVGSMVSWAQALAITALVWLGSAALG